MVVSGKKLYELFFLSILYYSFESWSGLSIVLALKFEVLRNVYTCSLVVHSFTSAFGLHYYLI